DARSQRRPLGIAGPSRAMTGRATRCAVAVLILGALGLAAWRTLRIETDLGAFLPPSATPEQRLLVSQLKDGLASRLLLIALDGPDEDRLADASRKLAENLSHAPDFEYAANGSLDQFAAQGEVLMRNRYALSPRVSAADF